MHVVDMSDPEIDLHMNIVYETLKKLEAENKPVITVMNKSDRLWTGHLRRSRKRERRGYLSAACFAFPEV